MKFSVRFDHRAKSARAAGYDLRVHFKNTRETAATIKGMVVDQAIKFLKDVIDKKTCIPFRRFNGGVGRTGQAKKYGITQGRWPTKSCKQLLSLLYNLQANAEGKDLSLDILRICHISVNRARPGRRRTYKAHGRINPYMSSPCHVQIIAKEVKDRKKILYRRNVVADAFRPFQLTVKRLRAIRLTMEKDEKKGIRERKVVRRKVKKGRRGLRTSLKKERGRW